ncbi:MAG: DNA-binding response regulator [Anaerolineaceae bacterium]|nr:MAG: DNA-binding response regulator [Anaerolineaceae bacterium]
MAYATILYIHRPTTKDEPTLASLSRKYTVKCVTSGKEALTLIASFQPDVVVLDAASLRTAGGRICRNIKAALPDVPLIHIPPDENAESCADVVLTEPTLRRLSNSIGRFLTRKTEEVLEYGPFYMNVPRRILISHGEEKQLTPKQAKLVALFLRHPEETLDRKTIMSRVWETEYIGDTRTLDVHIRWLRRVMECGNKKPRYLKTVRGVGYRLDLTPQ